MRILHLLNTDKFSGAENVVTQIVSMFKQNQDVEMIYCSPDGEIREALSERNVSFAPLRCMSAEEVKRVIKEQNIDIIHAHDMKASFVAAMACGKIPLISHIHNNAFDSRGVSAKSIAYLLAAFKAKHIFWVSRSAYTGYCFNRLVKNKSSVLYNILDIDALKKRAELDTKTYDYDVIFLGRMSFPKNPLRLMEVFKLLEEKKPDIKIAVVGTGEMEQEVKAKAEELGLKRVDFLGFSNNPSKILSDSKIMIMTSRWEGTPMCALEAAVLGTPIISTPVDGLKDLITNDKNGYLTDSNQELADKIIEYISDSKKLAELSANQVTKAIEWNDKAKYYNALIDVYEGESK